jgi:hypothetical protein
LERSLPELSRPDVARRTPASCGNLRNQAVCPQHESNMRTRFRN